MILDQILFISFPMLTISLINKIIVINLNQINHKMINIINL